jgi:Uma2 family endonuclease
MAETSSIAALPRMTVEEFVLWSERQPSGKYELVDGYVVVVRMQSERITHTRAKGEIWLALRTAIRAAGVPCEALTEGVTVKFSPHHGYEPDAVVNCGPTAPGDDMIVPNPIIVVEVLSPSTASKDMGVKVTDYFSLASIQHYLIVDPDRRVVIHHRRSPGPELLSPVLLTSFHSTGRLRLDPPGIEVEVTELFG